MAIKILTLQLANQIAAGEVVERPASAVKELIENSLDAAATAIEIEIEQGGAKLIRIRDNGSGIAKNDLALALARHATSKIDCLEDLEAISSLGFRGEALASISAVSRLTLTSTTVEQTEAWQVYAEGRDMNAVIKPAAHPVGTTVEIRDLFYNTPARRKFLRSDKTEFTHIDEIIRRFALTRPEVSFLLKHNGKLIRHYRQSVLPERVRTVTGETLFATLCAVEQHSTGLSLQGWVSTVDTLSVNPAIQYFYVNGRMVRDRLLTHAIRQAYQQVTDLAGQPEYLLYLTLDPREVDVNVHPTKQEVRFQQSRLVHDFIYQALLQTLLDSSAMNANDQNTGMPHYLSEQWSEPHTKHSTNIHAEQRVINRVAAGKNILSGNWQRPEAVSQSYLNKRTSLSAAEKQANWQWLESNKTQPQLAEFVDKKPLFPVNEMSAIGSLTSLSTESTDFQNFSEKSVSVDKLAKESVQEIAQKSGRFLAIYQDIYALFMCNNQFYLMSLNHAYDYWLQSHLDKNQSQPLIVPITFSSSLKDSQWLPLTELGFSIEKKNNKITFFATPTLLKEQNLHSWLATLLSELEKQPKNKIQLKEWVSEQLAERGKKWNLSQAIHLLAELERMNPDCLPKLLKLIDLQPTISAISNEFKR